RFAFILRADISSEPRDHFSQHEPESTPLGMCLIINSAHLGTALRSSLRESQSKAPVAQLLPEHAILLAQVVDCELLLLVHPSGHCAGALHCAITGVAWSPDGKRIASSDADGAVKVWDLEKRKKVLAWQAHAAPVRSIGWSSDGTRLASGGGSAE